MIVSSPDLDSFEEELNRDWPAAFRRLASLLPTRSLLSLLSALETNDLRLRNRLIATPYTRAAPGGPPNMMVSQANEPPVLACPVAFACWQDYNPKEDAEPSYNVVLLRYNCLLQAAAEAGRKVYQFLTWVDYRSFAERMDAIKALLIEVIRDRGDADVVPPWKREYLIKKIRDVRERHEPRREIVT